MMQMVKNNADNENSIKNAIEQSKFDTWNDRSMYTYCNYRDKMIVQEKFILEDYKNAFLDELEEIELPKEYWYQPAAFANYYYGTPELDFLVLYFAGIETMLDFNKEKIKVLPVHLVRTLLTIIEKHKDDVERSIQNPPTYYDTTLYRLTGKVQRNIIINGKVVNK